MFFLSFVLSYFLLYLLSFVLSFFRTFVLLYFLSFVLSFVLSFFLSYSFRSFILSFILSFFLLYSFLFCFNISWRGKREFNRDIISLYLTTYMNSIDCRQHFSSNTLSILDSFPTIEFSSSSSFIASNSNYISL